MQLRHTRMLLHTVSLRGVVSGSESSKTYQFLLFQTLSSVLEWWSGLGLHVLVHNGVGLNPELLHLESLRINMQL